MSYFVMGGMAIASIYSASESNKAISSAASDQMASNRLYAERDRKLGNNQQLLLGRDVNTELGAQLSNLVMESAQTKGQLITQAAESNIYGNLASRKQAVLGVQVAMSADNLQQQAEAKMQDIQTGLSDIAYGNDAKNAQITSEYNNSMSQMQSTTEIGMGAISAGASGYSMGSSISASNKTISTNKVGGTS